MALAFIPLYIHYLGIEAWGLVGFLAVLQAWLSILDMGLTPTLTREMARFSAGAYDASGIRNLLRSLEFVFGIIAVLIGVLICWVAPWIASYWLMAVKIPMSEVSLAISIMGFVVAARMVEQVYFGVLQGLQKQVWLNAVIAITSTLRWGGAVIVLVFYSPTIAGFFLWQGIASVVSLLIMMRGVYHFIPKSKMPTRFDWRSLMPIRYFAGGIFFTTIMVLVLTQADKLILSKIVPLNEFGYYMLAVTVANALLFLVRPIGAAIGPRLTELATCEDTLIFSTNYHQGSQWVSVMLIPSALVMAVFAEPLLWAWSGNRELAESSAPFLTLLAIGTMFNGFMHVPYMAQLAYGWASFAAKSNLFAALVLVPAILIAVPYFGAIAAAWIWLSLNAIYVFFSMHFMHNRLMKSEKWVWYSNAIAYPLLGGCAAILILWFSSPEIDSRFLTSLWLVFSIVITTFFVFIFTPTTRDYILKKINVK